jgi:hypothetical protein
MLKLQKYRINDVYRRNKVEGIDLTVERNGGTYLANSGNRTSEVFFEQYFRNKHPKTVPELNWQAAIKATSNEDLLRKIFYNTRGVTDRTQFKGPTEEFSFPLMNMGSGWYANATANRGPILTGTLPNAVPK